MDSEDEIGEENGDINLLSKMHEDLVKTIENNKPDVDQIVVTWRAMDLNHFPKKDEIKEKLEELKTEWKELCERAYLKKEKLNSIISAMVSIYYPYSILYPIAII